MSSALAFGVLSSIITATLGLGAEEIGFSYPPFGEFYISEEAKTYLLQRFRNKSAHLPGCELKINILS